MYCDKCGTLNDDNATYCEACGNQLRETKQDTDEKRKEFRRKAKQSIGKAVETVKKINTDEVKGKIRNTAETNKKVIVPIAAVSAVLIVGLLLLAIIGSQNTPQKVAEKFFKAYANGNYSTMYNYFFDYQSDYINQDTVVAYLNTATNNAGGSISKFKVASAYNYEYEDDYSEYDNSLAFSERMLVSYLPSGDSREKTLALEVVTLKESGPKAFRKYKVTLGEGVADNVTILVGAGASVAIDGIKLTDPVDSPNPSDLGIDEDLAYYQNYFDVFQLGKIIAGEHKVIVSDGGFETQEMEVSLYNSNIIDLFSNYSRELTAESKSLLNKKTDAVVKALFYGAIADKSFSSLGIEDPFGENADEYDEIVDDFDSYNISGITLKETDMSGSIVVQRYQVDYMYSYESWGSTYTRDGSRTITLYLLYSEKDRSFQLVDLDY